MCSHETPNTTCTPFPYTGAHGRLLGRCADGRGWPPDAVCPATPREASQPWDSLRPRVMVAHLPCTPGTQCNKQVHSHRPKRLRLTKPRVLGLEHHSFRNGKSHHRDQHILPNSKICNMGSQAIIRMLLGKPE